MSTSGKVVRNHSAPIYAKEVAEVCLNCQRKINRWCGLGGCVEYKKAVDRYTAKMRAKKIAEAAEKDKARGIG